MPPYGTAEQQLLLVLQPNEYADLSYKSMGWNGLAIEGKAREGGRLKLLSTGSRLDGCGRAEQGKACRVHTYTGPNK